MKITLDKNNIYRLRLLLESIGSEYKAVPIRIYKEYKNEIVQKSECNLEIKVAADDASEIFSSNLLLEDINGMEDDEELNIKLPVNRSTLNTLYTFDSLEIDNSSITAKTDKKELTMSLLVLDKVYNYELHSEDLYHHYRNDNNYIIFNPDKDEIKEFLSLFSTLKISDKDKVSINVSTTDKGLLVSAKDKLDSSFKYIFTIDNPNNIEIDSEYGYSFISMLSRISKLNDINNINILVSDILISTNCWNDILVMNFAVPSK